jgi:hypothetical protein
LREADDVLMDALMDDVDELEREQVEVERVDAAAPQVAA